MGFIGKVLFKGKKKKSFTKE
jgi:hypothetical protein